MTNTYTPGRHAIVPDASGHGFALQAYDGDLIAYGMTEADATLFALAGTMAGLLRQVAAFDVLPEADRKKIESVLKETVL